MTRLLKEVGGLIFGVLAGEYHGELPGLREEFTQTTDSPRYQAFEKITPTGVRVQIVQYNADDDPTPVGLIVIGKTKDVVAPVIDSFLESTGIKEKNIQRPELEAMLSLAVTMQRQGVFSRLFC